MQRRTKFLCGCSLRVGGKEAKKNQKLCFWITSRMEFLATVENGSGKGFGGKIKRVGFG